MTETDHQKLLFYARDQNKLNHIRDLLSQPNGGISQGALPELSWAKKILGETFDKVILATKGVEKLGIASSDFTVLGGWCAIRTYCLREISSGNITDFNTGKKKQFTTVLEVCEWLENAVSIDQIVDAVGIYSGIEYALISEEKLWSSRVVKTLERYFDKRLTTIEKKAVYAAIQTSEEKRYHATRKYLEYCTGRKVHLTRIIDKDIYDDLVLIRSQLLKKINTSLSDLVKPTIDRITLQKKILENIDLENLVKSINTYIKTYSLIWIMYTGPYLHLLQDRGYVKTPKGLIIEPWNHLSGIEIEAKAEFNFRLFGQNNSRNNYLAKDSINEDIAFIGIEETSDYNWKRYRSTRPISDVPNMVNYSHYIKALSKSEKLKSIDLSLNPAFMDGFNFLPYNETRTLLFEMVLLKENYSSARKKILKKMESKEQQRKSVQKLRENTSLKMEVIAKKIYKELEGMLNTVFS